MKLGSTGWGAVVSLALALAVMTPAHAATGLALVCPDASKAGASVSVGCPGELYKTPAAGDLVRTASGPSPVWGEPGYGYAAFGPLAPGSYYEVAKCDLPAGALNDNATVAACNTAGGWGFATKGGTPSGDVAYASLTINWALPTAGCSVGVTPCDGKPLTGSDALTGVEVYVSGAPIPDGSSMAPTATLAAGATSAVQTLQAAAGSTLYVRVKAVNANGKSPFSVQGSAVVPTPAPKPVVPGAPTSITIQLTLTP